ncbi:hypothetical protein M426DRAFT_26581 [Hypoxylon sp. CI-4A]|nr:hypothetical protein M426DRAFT_26581 [Hypoxylon sp. CI-4A]
MSTYGFSLSSGLSVLPLIAVAKPLISPSTIHNLIEQGSGAHLSNGGYMRHSDEYDVDEYDGDYDTKMGDCRMIPQSPQSPQSLICESAGPVELLSARIWHNTSDGVVSWGCYKDIPSWIRGILVSAFLFVVCGRCSLGANGG